MQKNAQEWAFGKKNRMLPYGFIIALYGLNHNLNHI